MKLYEVFQVLDLARPISRGVYKELCNKKSILKVRGSLLLRFQLFRHYHFRLQELNTSRDTKYLLTMVTALKGTYAKRLQSLVDRLIYSGILVEVDPSIKAVIVKINDQESGEYIIHELDDEHVLIHKDKLEKLKDHIQSVCRIYSSSNLQTDRI